MMATDRFVSCLRGFPTSNDECLEFWRRVLIPGKHGMAWMLAWSHGVQLRMLMLKQCSCRWSGLSGEHGLGRVLESLEACRRIIGQYHAVSLH
jgi:hypothetical protein